MTTAEELLDFANEVKRSPGIVLMCGDEPMFGYLLAALRTGLDMRARPGLALRATVEGWSIVRLNRELY